MLLDSTNAPFRFLRRDLDDWGGPVVEPDFPTDEESVLELLAIDWYWQFQHDQYDWNDPEFIRNNKGRYAYRVIPLTQGYFMIVSPCDYKRMTTYPDGSPKRWYASLKRDPRTGQITEIYARRSGRSGEPSTVSAHRELIGCLGDSGVVDHKNGFGLDNRRGTRNDAVNLRYTSRSENMHNTVRSRRRNPDLPPGVERRRLNRHGQQLYGGIHAKRLGPKRSKVFRSKRLWLTPEAAAQWYRNQLKKRCRQRTEWAHDPKSVNYPVFPPLRPDAVPF